ncbi:hypothetical protein K493DRAFT_357059 [Basidiobolus meristosporus CBS 931.73]|uniref:Uncharacterized protein n=1 Tax=Basidiobolus meristosporus CBS 931.73 TaxID=1314790 RepID=A0A1Y1XWU4_9FUNG|nr:hypothetical protein K493DRAFT_357059 [Basidiobolus meristosporus CBS 931.73]|eukprot:ORX90227.1 hypothetical protein K493DRAFT_357059 [Basidiobolus meristosporus CBS 931.73]
MHTTNDYPDFLQKHQYSHPCKLLPIQGSTRPFPLPTYPDDINLNAFIEPTLKSAVLSKHAFTNLDVMQMTLDTHTVSDTSLFLAEWKILSLDKPTATTHLRNPRIALEGAERNDDSGNGAAAERWVHDRSNSIRTLPLATKTNAKVETALTTKSLAEDPMGAFPVSLPGFATTCLGD